jgi:hypothetical protein
MVEKIDETVRADALEIFQHFKGIGMPASDIFRVSEYHDLNHSYHEINIACQLLVEQKAIVKGGSNYGGSHYGISIKPDESLFLIPRSTRKEHISPANLCKQIDELMFIRRVYRAKPKQIFRPKRIPKPFPLKPSPPSGRCDRCGRKFERGEVPHIRKFSNIKLYLCDDCHEQKKIVTVTA